MSAEDVTRVARIALPDGTPVWARISGAEELSAPAAPAGRLSYSDTGFTERVEASVESLHALVTGVARSLAEPLRAVRPDEVSVEFGIELTAKAGKVVGLLADGEAKAGITVTLTWNSGPPDLDASPPAADPHAATAPRARDGSSSTAPRARDGSSSDAGAARRAGASPGAPMHGGGDGTLGGGGA
ncbi:CU044_2847 family protein [Streptomyces sp. NPDC020951]|uniref:CU044_2847 family protein n=1 Tax=Streptomyces sp. NPDC020951 TaxID=3365104 RepID=UPI0037B7E4E4